jgi:hypothetical protein
MNEASGELQDCLQQQSESYPDEYKTPVGSLENYQSDGPAIVMAHSLLPKTLYHAFSTFGSLMSPDLPLTRRQHEMIAATVSALNRCFY